MAPPSSCLSENELVDLVRGNLDPARAAEAEAHIDECNACRLVLIELARIFELRASALPAENPSDTALSDRGTALLEALPPVLMRGSEVGRYLILGTLGVGAMGVVYAAHDPELDRKVALKLLRDRVVDAEQGDRLLREARVTAKLAHPNVVVVHDVGTHDGSVFMAMEFVEGGTLSAWQGERRSREEILTAYIDAGRGLAAAHRAGLVHRDFKPANVLMGADGRARVTDFGLARIGTEDLFVDRDDSTEADARVDGLTKTGTIIGTPAYMSPEQFQGRVADARSDQFSFCVALFEALCGERPFPGQTFSELATAVSQGKLQHGETFSALPRTLRTALVRGLSIDPDRRFADFDELLPALDVSARPRPVMPALVGGGIALGLGVFGFTMGARSDTDQCVDELQAFGSVWSSSRRDTLDTGLRASGLAYAGDVSERVRDRLDRYVEHWEESFEAACRASAASARTQCLRARGRDFEQLVAALERGEATVVEFAVQAVERLEPPSTCRDGGEQGTLPPPTPPMSLAEDVDALALELSLAKALNDTRQFEAALDHATTIRERAVALDYPPSIAEAELVRGRSLASMQRMDAAEEAFVTAAQRAWSTGHESVAVQSATELIFVSGVMLNKPDVGEVWADFARASLDRVGGGASVRALLSEGLGALAHHRGSYQDAEARLIDALSQRRSFLPPDHTLIGATISRLAAAVLAQEKFTEGLAYAEQGLEIYRRALGESHPSVMRAHSLRGTALLQLGRVEEGRDALERALEIGLAAYGADGAPLTDIYSNLGSLALRRGDLEDADAKYRKVLVALEADGTARNNEAIVLHNLGTVALRADRFEDARTYFQRSVEVREALFGTSSPKIAASLASLATVAMRSGQCVAAVEPAERAYALLGGEGMGVVRQVHVQETYARALMCSGREGRALAIAREVHTRASMNPDLVRVRGLAAELLADAEFVAGTRSASEDAARRALENASSPNERSSASFRIARILVDRDRDAAVAMAREALDAAEGADRERIAAFLAEH